MTNRVLQTIAVTGIAALLLVSGCKISKQGSGEDKKVSIEVPGASVNVDTGRAANDTGIALYPGAQEKRGKQDDDRAHVSVDTPFLKVKVIALKYTSTDAPDKILAFYRNKLIAFGSVVECKGSTDPIDTEGDRNLSSPVRCGKQHHEHADEISLKTGTEGNQHVVIVKPSGTGSEFTLLYLHLGNAKNEDDYSGKQPS